MAISKRKTKLGCSNSTYNKGYFDADFNTFEILKVFDSDPYLYCQEKLMTTKHERAGWDGVANVKYRLDSVINNQTFTTIRVDLRRFITNEIKIRVARRPLMTINPLQREQCKWVEIPGKYLDAQFIKGSFQQQNFLFSVLINSKIRLETSKVLGKDNRRAFGFEEVQKICNELGQACAGFVKENDYSNGMNYFPREKAVITR